MSAYELLAHLKYLVLTVDEKGHIEWVGKTEDWRECRKEIENYERF